MSVAICSTPATPTATVTQPTCSVSTGTINLSGLPSSGTWTLNRSGTSSAAIPGSGTTYSDAGLAAGNYTYTVTVSGGCVSAASATQTINAAPAVPATPAITAINPTCAVLTGGITVTSPVGGVTYTLVQTGATSTSGAFTGLAAGSGPYTVTASNGTCVSAASNAASVGAAATGCCTVPTNVVLTGSSATYCQGATATALTATFTGDHTGAIYYWQDQITNTNSSNNTATFIPPTTTIGTNIYRLIIYNNCGNGASSTTVTITVVGPPATPAITAVNPTCSLSTGSITVASPVSGITYTLVQTGATSTSGTFTGLAAGSGPYTVTASNGTCTPVVSNAVSIGAQPVTPSAPTFAAATQPTCAVATGTINLTGLPASGSWTLSRSGTSSAAIPGSGTTYANTGLAPGTYTYTVTNASGCVSTASATQTINAQPVAPTQPTLTAGTQPTCSVATGTFTISNYNAAYTYTISPSTGVSRSGATVTAPAGTYTVTATSGTCISTASASQTINAQPVTPATPTLSATAATNVCPATTANLSALVTSTTPSGSTLEFHTSATPTAGNLVSTPGAVGAGTYYAFYVNTAGGCYSPASAAITATITACVVPVPDLTPTIYARSSTTYGTTNISVVVDVTELLSVPTNGLITVYVTKDSKAPLTFSATATSVNSRAVQNSAWTFDGTTSGSFYILTTTQVIPADGVLSFGLRGQVVPGATKGTLTLSAIIDNGSGSETMITNNSDADKINYFDK